MPQKKKSGLEKLRIYSYIIFILAFMLVFSLGFYFQLSNLQITLVSIITFLILVSLFFLYYFKSKDPEIIKLREKEKSVNKNIKTISKSSPEFKRKIIIFKASMIIIALLCIAGFIIYLQTSSKYSLGFLVIIVPILIYSIMTYYSRVLQQKPEVKSYGENLERIENEGMGKLNLISKISRIVATILSLLILLFVFYYLIYK